MRYRWLILFLVFLATALNYLDRQLIGLLKPLLESRFNWSEKDYAHIVMAFTAAYAIGLLGAGRLIDRIGTRTGYLLTLAFWSVAAMFHALARSATGFIIARAALGLGEGGNFPAAVKTVAEWFPKKERGIATGIFNAGTSVGVIFSLIAVPTILRFGGWQEVFWITGALGGLWMILWWIYYESPQKQKRLSTKELAWIKQDDSPAYPQGSSFNWLRLFRYPQTWAYITGKGLIDPIFWFFLFWLPSYFAATFKLNLQQLSPELIIIYFSTTVGSIFGGWLSSRLIFFGWPALKARKITLLLFALMELSIFINLKTTDTWTAVAVLSICVAAHQGWAANVFTLASDLFPSQVVSSVVGIGGMAGAIGGLFFPWLVGEILENYKQAQNLTGGYQLIFLICGCTYFVALAIIHLLTRGRERVNMEELQ